MQRTDSAVAVELRKMEEALDDLRVEQARESLPHFMEYVMHDENGNPWKVAKHQKLWSELVCDPTIPLVEIVYHRLSAKTTFVQAYILWELGRNPCMCFKYVCGSDSKAVDRLRLLKKQIVANERYQRVFPHIRQGDVEDEWSKHKIFIDRPADIGLQDASIECSTVLSGDTGGRCHRLILDDIVDSRNAILTTADLPKIKRMIEEDWLNCLFTDGKAIAIGTFWSFDPPDPYVEFEQSDAWHTVKGPACHLDVMGNLVGPFNWPERWGPKELETRREQIGHDAFNQQFLLLGAMAKTQLFSREAVQRCKCYDFALGEIPEDVEIVKIGIGLDPATGRGKTASYAGVATVAKTKDGSKIPLSLIRVKADPEAVADAAFRQWVIWDHAIGCPIMIRVENNGAQLAFETLIRLVAERNGVLHVPTMSAATTGRSKWVADSSLPVMNAEFSSGLWQLPFGGDHTGNRHDCPICQFERELIYWGRPRDNRGQHVTTDLVMASWLASSALDRHSVRDFPLVLGRERRSVRYGPSRSLAWTTR